VSSARVSPAARGQQVRPSVAASLAKLTGLRAGLLAFVLGALGALAQAPFYLWPFLALALTVFVWQLDGASATARPRLAAFWRGWCLGFGYFLAGLWWVGSAFLVEPERYAALIPLAITALPAGLALFWGAIGATAVSFWRRDWRRVVLLATVFFLFEFARGHVLTGFPWNLAGQVWPAGGAISQSAAFIGVYGLTALTLFAFMAPAAPMKRGVSAVAPPLVGVAVFGALFALGQARLATAETAVEPGVHLRIVQAQIDQREKWKPENRDAVRDHYLALTAKEGLDTRTHVIWAESALPVRLLEEPRLLDAVAHTLGEGRVLLTGFIRRDISDPLAPRYYNSFGVIAVEDGIPQPVSIYDKVKLVPFGEYTPFAALLNQIAPKSLLEFDDGYSPGPGPATLTVPGAPPVAPQICYEVVFPGFTPRGADRPGWIVNVTNDAWYTGTPGPYQLYNQARYRAIEEGVPLARAASGGFSALIDPYGRVVAGLPHDADDVIDADLPKALRPPLYALVGDAPGFLLAVAGLVLGLTRKREGM
jgi:apolipoprotein N-acyltransferase